MTIVASGDLLVHDPVRLRAAEDGRASGRAYDFRPMFEPVRDEISAADLALCHLEVPLDDDNAELSTYPLFYAPRQLADALVHAGYDACSVASNHALDQGSEGVRTTLDVLDAAGLEHEGTARSRAEARRPLVLDANGVKVGHVSYTYGLNGMTTAPGRRWEVNVIDARRILRDARAARAAGAEVVVVSLHWGLEYQSEPTADQVALARRLLRSDDVDLLFGHHAHVVQPIDRVGGEFVVYGLGNFLSNQHPGASATCCPAETQDGLLVRVEIAGRDELRVRGVRYTPTWVEPGTYRILPVAAALDASDDPARRAELAASWQRTTATVESMRAPVRPTARPQRLP